MDRFVVKGQAAQSLAKDTKEYRKSKAKQAKLTDLPGVIVTDKYSDFVRSGISGQSYQRQSKLFELKGVVVLEKISEYKEKLQSSEVAIDEKISILDELYAKQPSTDIIRSSKIGKIVRKLAEDSSEDKRELSRKAGQVYDKWKALIERRVELSSAKSCEEKRSQLEVRYDEETNRQRTKSVQFLRETLSTSDDRKGKTSIFPTQEKLITKLEQYVFEIISKKLVNSRYNRTMRKIILCLKNNEDVRQELFFHRSLSIENFVQDFAR